MVDRPGPAARNVSDFSLDEPEVPLYESSKERLYYEEMANLYAIIMATEHLERAFALDAIDHKTYTQQCKRLISQFNVAEFAIRDKMTTETFMKLYEMECPRAVYRLLQEGIPQAMKGAHNDASHAVTVAETVQCFITTMDAVRLGQKYVDELQPLISDLMDSLTKLPQTPNDFEPNRKVQSWLLKLNKLKAVDEIGEGDIRQLLHDLDSSYADFNKYLKSQGSS